MFIKFTVLLAVALSYTKGNPIEKPRAIDPFSTRIVGGIDAPEGYGKYMAVLVYGQPWAIFICGGTIVTQRHILTAAHCVEMFLSWNLQLLRNFRGIIGTKEWWNGTPVTFTDYKMHEKWHPRTIKNDIAVLTVSKDMKTSDLVAIMPINFDEVIGGEVAYVTGWGILGTSHQRPTKLQLLYVKTVPSNECKERIERVVEEMKLEDTPPVQSDIEICTLHSRGHGMCNGDSGSAVVKKDTEELIGVVSWGIPCALGAPDVHVRVSAYRDWLLDIIGDHIQKPSL